MESTVRLSKAFDGLEMDLSNGDLCLKVLLPSDVLEACFEVKHAEAAWLRAYEQHKRFIHFTAVQVAEREKRETLKLQAADLGREAYHRFRTRPTRARASSVS